MNWLLYDRDFRHERVKPLMFPLGLSLQLQPTKDKYGFFLLRTSIETFSHVRTVESGSKVHCECSSKNAFEKQRLADVFKINVLINFAIFTGKHLCWSLFLIKSDLNACNFMKKRLQHKCFPVKFVKSTFFNRTPPVASSECKNEYAL